MLSNHTEVDLSKTTSRILNEYIPFKKSNTDSIVFFQIGEFFEVYFEDAYVFSQITGTVLTSKIIKDVGEVPQCGFPTSSLDNYVKKILDSGYKVCVCVQCYCEQTNSFYRQISRKYTKGTILENTFLNAYENNFIAAISKLDDSCYSYSYADVSTGQFYITKATFQQIIFELDKIEPNELLLLRQDVEKFKKISSKYNITLLDDEFASLSADKIIQEYCKLTQKEFCVKLSDVAWYDIKNYLVMDELTRINLELTRTKRFLKKKGSIFWFLNCAKTPMGIRLLKKYLNEPLLDIKTIEDRQKAVEDLLQNSKMLDDFENVLNSFCDLSRICSQISNSTIYPRDLFQISKNSKMLEQMSVLCHKFNSKLLKLNQDKLTKLLDFANEIKKVLKEEANNEIKSGGIIKEGYYPNLDYLKSKLKNCEIDIENYQQKERKHLDINNLNISYNKILGYFIEIPSAKAFKMTSDYVKKQTLTSCVRYTTSTLKQLEQEFFNLKYQINELEYELYCQLRKKALDFVDIIRSLAQEIAIIDVMCAFAKCAKTNNLIKPRFSKSNLRIKNGFHPSLLKLNNEIVKNDTDIKDGEMMILTGANMSGKSTYLKHNAIIILLSQIGCFVPADSAEIAIVDKIFLHQGSSDDIINNNSSFMVEMNDLKFILDNITNRSLVLLDEPAKSTSAQEGGAIARAFCEYVLERYKAKYIIATHNLELTKIETDFPNKAFNCVMGNSSSDLSSRKISKGILSTSCALNTAKLAQLPQELIANAKKYLKNF